ncbi:hypothetical protein SAMN02745165_02541 [Malonomonas rubra DSM 5091]|uniref:Ammonium transporter n=1 Tax=Malonomonas rubra DSM 5091 TaxID=1122189 RepID=A0A1M6JW85_MALRU|nr:hypothetical protein [Malonomonas rubra]SHJ50964.1 hypothetical protein SAMN02745165_02541 [Malonomonas rubra DSM 5091]
MKKVLSAAFSMMVLATPVLAETGAREDSSNVLVWAFLGICGLIIFLQMVPVATLAFGLIKGVFSKKEAMEDELETATSKYR